MVASLSYIRSSRSPSSCLVWLKRVSVLFLLLATSNGFAVAKKNKKKMEKTNQPEPKMKQTLKVKSVAPSLSDKRKQKITSGTQNIAGETANATALAQKLAAGTTVIKNATFLLGNSKQFGVFTGGLNSINISDGIVISTGEVANVKGPNSMPSMTTQFNTPGYPPLNDLLPNINLTDAAVFQITFTCPNPPNELQFTYVFASEEYPEYVYQEYNDVFAFYLNGLQKTDNVAVLPDGRAVAINTVNCGSLKNSTGTNCNLFRNNSQFSPPAPGSQYDIEFDGFTVPLQVLKRNLTGGDNVITLAIADAGDAQFDTAVFIQGQSLSCRAVGAPTRAPTKAPVGGPSKPPTRAPTRTPTKAPTSIPVMGPSNPPTRKPTSKPTITPTRKPTRKPTKKPTKRPTTKKPTRKPSPTIRTKKPRKRLNELSKCLKKVRQNCECSYQCSLKGNNQCPGTVVDTQCLGLRKKRRTIVAYRAARLKVIEKYASGCSCCASGSSKGKKGSNGKGSSGDGSACGGSKTSGGGRAMGVFTHSPSRPPQRSKNRPTRRPR